MNENNKQPESQSKNAAPTVPPKDFRAIVMYGMTNQEALAIMKAVKELSPSMRDTAFAMTTDTNIAWPLGQLIAELSEEHRMMKEWSSGKKTNAQ